MSKKDGKVNVLGKKLTTNRSDPIRTRLVAKVIRDTVAKSHTQLNHLCIVSFVVDLVFTTKCLPILTLSQKLFLDLIFALI